MENSDDSIIKVTPGKGKEENVATIVLHGDLSLNNTQKIKSVLLEVIDRYQSFNIKLIDVENIDLGLIQVLKAFYFGVTQKGKNLKIKSDLTDDQVTLLKNSGLAEVLNINE